jgi:hypothetical protein
LVSIFELIALLAIALLLLLTALIFRERLGVHPIAYHSENVPAAVSHRDAFFPGKTITNQQFPIATTVATSQKTDAAESSLIGSANGAPVTGALISGEASAPFAIVNIKRILAARQSDITSPESQLILLAKIKQIISARARSNHWEFVFDTSDTTINGTPAFINPTNGALDLTEEVLKVLSR